MGNDPKVWISEETNMPNCGWSVANSTNSGANILAIYIRISDSYPEIQPQRNKTNRRYIDIHIDTDTDIKGDTIRIGSHNL